MHDFRETIIRHWPSAVAAITLLLPWEIHKGGFTIPLIRLVESIAAPNSFGFFVLIPILTPGLLHILLLLNEPTGGRRLFLQWTALLLPLFFSGFYVIVLLVGGREVFAGALPGTGLPLALLGCLLSLVWEPLHDRGMTPRYGSRLTDRIH